MPAIKDLTGQTFGRLTVMERGPDYITPKGKKRVRWICKCSCGNPAPWLQLEGRTDDVISFIENNVEIKIAPLAIYATLKEVHELRRFQLVAHDGNHIELRLEPSESIAREDAFAKAQETLIDFLKTHGVTHVEINLSSELPKQQEGSGKFKHIIRA